MGRIPRSTLRRIRAASGWPGELAARSVQGFLDDRCTRLAAAISYHVLFSIFPLAIVVVAVAGLVLDDAEARERVLDALFSQTSLSESAEDEIKRLLAREAGGFGAAGLVGLAGLVWSASAMMGAIRDGINTAWGLERGQRFLRGKLLDMGLVLVFGLVVGLSLGLTIAIRFVADASDRLGPPGTGKLLLGVAALALPLLLSFGAFLAVFRIVPAVPTRVRDVWPGALVGAALFELAKNGLAVYFTHFGRYGAVYGSLGAVTSFLFFVFVAACVLLFAAEVAGEWPGVREGRRGRAEAAAVPPSARL